MLLRLFIFILTFSSLIVAGELKLSEQEEYTLGLYVDYYEDVQGAESIETVRSLSFKPVAEESPSFGFTKSVYWFKITLIPDHFTALNWWLIFNYPLLEHIELFGYQGDGDTQLFHAISGRLHHYEQRQLAQRQFAFSINNLTQPTTLYIRVKTQGSMQVPMQLKTSKKFLEGSQLSQLLFGLYYGVFTIIILYNLIMYNYTKENDYLRYIFFVTTFIGWQLTLDGFGIQYLWSDWEWMVANGAAFWMSLAMTAAVIFSRYFLRTEQHFPWLDKVLMLLILIGLALTLSSIILPYGVVIRSVAITVIIISIILWISGIVLWHSHYRPARFYVIGWGFFLMGSVLLAINKLNLLHGFYFLNYAQQIGSALEMIFLSWALADRVKLLQDEYVEKLSSLNVVLQGKVREALDHAREKDKVMMSQSRLAALGEMIEQIAHQWRQPLNTMALLNQDLYIKKQLGQLSDDDVEYTHEQINNNLQYMSGTIDDFRNIHMPHKEQEHFTLEEVINTVITLNEASLNYSHISCNVTSMNEHYVKSYKNELIQILMNLIKNSRDAIVEKQEPKGHIDIGVTEDSEYFVITVEDNGGGVSEKIIDHIFDPYFTTKEDSKGSGIGLFMSRTIIEENLHGSLNVENGKAGARFILTLTKPS
ncbi:MAG: sensor histidine kinase [Campylobacterota bacterium]|nr:sensor histidine kinase [Campylobacterota bacterium]